MIVLTGIIFIIVSISTIGTLDPTYKNWEAVITDIIIENESAVDEEDYIYKTYVKYEIEGKTYEEELGYYASGMKVGDTVKIKYDPYDPSNIYHEGSRTVSYIMIGAGIVSVLLGIYAFWRGIVGKF